MATVFKTFGNNDSVATRTLLHESIPITGTIVSGTYADENIKNYAHEMFQSVYDYPYLSSSANHIFDISAGFSPKSDMSGSSTTVQASKKMNIYNQMAQVLVGNDVTGSIKEFDISGSADNDSSSKMREVLFVNLARLLTKDEIKKGSVEFKVNTLGNPSANEGTVTLKDDGAQSSYYVNSPAGEYGVLYDGANLSSGDRRGLVFYQAGVIVISGSVFEGEFGEQNADYDTSSFDTVFGEQSITASCNALRNRFANLSFNNTTELNSTVYFCRANHNEFNYSSNPTYVNGSKINVKSTTSDAPITYITSVGMYSADGELLATAKLSEPIKKSSDTELTIRTRLDF